MKLVSGLTRDQIRQFFVDQPLGGRLLSEWVDRSFTSGAQQLMLDAIRAGVMQGESYRKLERRVMDAAAQGFGITQREAATLVRTYVQSANTGAQEAVYKQNEDIIRGYKRVETLDNHTCRIPFSALWRKSPAHRGRRKHGQAIFFSPRPRRAGKRRKKKAKACLSAR